MTNVSLFNCTFERHTKKEVILKIENLIQSNNRDYLCTVNVSMLMMARNNKRLRKFIQRSSMVVADGQPIVWASRYIKESLPERITGIDLAKDIPELACKNGWGIYLLGASEDVVKQVSEIYKKQYPSLIISGYRNGYFNKKEANIIAQEIKKSEARILIVAMGVPRQEYFIDDHWDQLGVNFAMGIGGSFDVIAGLTKRAPIWIQKYGLEWLYRMLQEPRRLFMRYFISNTKFILIIIKRVIYRALNINNNQA